METSHATVAFDRQKDYKTTRGFPTIIVVSRTEQTRRDNVKEIKDNSRVSNSSQPLHRSKEDSFIQG